MTVKYSTHIGQVHPCAKFEFNQIIFEIPSQNKV